MAVERNRPDNTDPAEDDAFFKDADAQLSLPGWVVLRVNIDREVLDWFRRRWPDYRSTMNQVLRAYMDRKMQVVIPVKEYSSDRVEVVGKYDPAVVQWVETKPNSDGFVSLILRDFMKGCLDREAGSKAG